MRRVTGPSVIVGFMVAFLIVLLASTCSYAQSWEKLLVEGKQLQRNGHLDSAVAICIRALELAESEFGPYDSTVGVVAHRIGGLFLGFNRDAEAREYELMALEIWDSLSGLQLPIEAFTLHNLGNAEKNLGMSLEARYHLEKAVTLKRQSTLVKPGSLASSIVALANLLAEGGHLIEAEKLAREAVDIRTQLYGPDSPKTLGAKNVLGHVNHYQARAREAAEIYNHIVETFSQTGDSSAALIMSNNLAAAYNELGLYAKAESTLTFLLANLSAFRTLRKQVEAHALKNLGRSYFHQHMYAEAELCYGKEIEIVKELHGESHLDYFGSMFNMANTYRESGQYESASSLYDDLIQKVKSSHGREHPLVGHGLREKARLYLRRDLPDSALASARDAFETFAGRFYKDLVLLSEATAFGYSSHMRRAAEVYVSSILAVDNPTSASMEEAANLILSVKGPVSDEIINRDRFLRECKDPNIKTLFESYKKARLEAAELTATEERSEKSDNRTDSLAEKVEELERKLVSASGHFRDYSDPEPVKANEIVRRLPPNSILIEYLAMGRFDDADSTQQGHYICLTTTNEGVKSIRDLGCVHNIQGLVEAYRLHMRNIESLEHFPTSRDLRQYDSLAAKLYGTVWQPLEGDIGSRKNIVLSPDGVLNLVSFAGLKNSHGRYLVEDLTIQYLSAGRDLLRRSERRVGDSRLLAVGNPDYDASVEDRVAQLKKATFASVNDTMVTKRTRGLGAPNRSIADLRMGRLDGTQHEIEQILSDSSLFSSTTVLTGTRATEDRFKRLAPQATTIHLATHGFYLRSDYPESDFEIDPLTMFTKPTNPLMESGLFFAGGNLHGAGADSAGIDDGILFAEEVSMMDLRNTDLVVLSACETGLGELQEGEGVFGLRKAFRVAGAKAVVSALWSVPDQLTTDLMAEIYKASDLNIAARVRSAQLTVIDRMRRDGDPTHPYLWAGFISTGR